MADTYELFRISLIVRSQPDMFEGYDTPREEYIRKVFSKKLSFDHYKTPFHFVPHRTQKSKHIIGGIGREVKSVENLSPEEGFEEQLHESWRACIVVIDPSDTEDGQKLAIELNLQIGAPNPIIRSLLRHINEENDTAPYRMEAQPIFDAATFWRFADEHKGEIVRLTFDFVAPNGLWSAKLSITEELRETNAATRAQEVSTTFKSQTGLDTDSPRIKDAVEYSESGSGQIKAKTRSGRTFSSTNKIKRTTLLDETTGRVRSKLARAAANIARILDHE